MTLANIADSWIFDHLGLVVKSLERGRSALEASLLIRGWTPETIDPVNGVRLQFGRDLAGVVYELLEPLGEDSPVQQALVSSRNILNHVAYRVSDLTVAAAHLKATKNTPTSTPKPAVAYGGAQIQFFVSPLNFIIELIEAPTHQHIFSPVEAS